MPKIVRCVGSVGESVFKMIVPTGNEVDPWGGEWFQ
jgi:hypothetical protein